MLDLAVIIAILLPNIGGWVSAATMIGYVKSPDGKAWYQTLRKPSWNPPNWVFGPAWTILYATMGYASYLVFKECGGFTDAARMPLGLYGVQLLLNYTWSPIFFKYHKIGLALINIVILDVLVAWCAVSFLPLSKQAAYLMLPYLAWLGFASCLNFSIWKLNKGNRKIKKKPKKM